MDLKVKDLIYRKDKIMPKEVCNYFIDLFKQNIEKTQKEASTKHIVNEGSVYKLDNFKSLDLSKLYKNNPEIEKAKNLAFRYIEMMILNYTQYLKINISPVINNAWWTTTANIRVMRYQEGEQILDHLDVNKRNRAACTINLNEDYEGGDFSFFSGKELYTLKTGDSIFFPAEPIFIHGTKKVTKGIRYSINCFLYNESQNKECCGSRQ